MRICDDTVCVSCVERDDLTASRQNSPSHATAVVVALAQRLQVLIVILYSKFSFDTGTAGLALPCRMQISVNIMMS